MKTKLLLILLATASMVLAQSPTPAPTPTVITPIVLNTDATAASQAAQIVANSLNYNYNMAKTIMANGYPARNGKPAVSATALKAQFTPETLAKIQAMLDAVK